MDREENETEVVHLSDDDEQPFIMNSSTNIDEDSKNANVKDVEDGGLTLADENNDNDIPRKGMTFMCLDAAQEFYDKYAFRVSWHYRHSGSLHSSKDRYDPILGRCNKLADISSGSHRTFKVAIDGVLRLQEEIFRMRDSNQPIKSAQDVAPQFNPSGREGCEKVGKKEQPRTQIGVRINNRYITQLPAFRANEALTLGFKMNDALMLGFHTPMREFKANEAPLNGIMSNETSTGKF
ncbi:hypothetical protein Scep_001388 [Stephania cephalantha]|uniref:Uncharacterized protein n=1 Tax=Stephania cephalantha TaxID=152367 RepID=A0AAP0L7T3_9MAGN